MTQSRHHFYSLHELLIMAALAALGGVSGSAVSWIGASLHAVIGLPGGLQFMAGIHVLWLILAVGLVRKPGAATLTGLLKGTVELFSGNPHGLIVILMSGLGGLTVDLAWILTGRRHCVFAYMLAGGLGAASNLLVFKFVLSLPSHRIVNAGLIALAAVAFVSGALLAGMLGWSLMNALRRAGVVGVQKPTGGKRPWPRAWVRVVAAGAAAFLIGTAILSSTDLGTPEAPEALPSSHAIPPKSASAP